MQREVVASAWTQRDGRMEWLPQHGLKPAGEPSGQKVTHFTLPLTPNKGAEIKDVVGT